MITIQAQFLRIYHHTFTEKDSLLLGYFTAFSSSKIYKGIAIKIHLRKSYKITMTTKIIENTTN